MSVCVSSGLAKHIHACNYISQLAHGHCAEELHLPCIEVHPKDMRVGSRVSSTDPVPRLGRSILEPGAFHFGAHRASKWSTRLGQMVFTRHLRVWGEGRCHLPRPPDPPGCPKQVGGGPRCTGKTLGILRRAASELQQSYMPSFYNSRAGLCGSCGDRCIGYWHRSPGRSRGMVAVFGRTCFSGWAINFVTQGHYNLYTWLIHKSTTTLVWMLHRWGAVASLSCLATPESLHLI